jgi:hypothetical protein
MMGSRLCNTCQIYFQILSVYNCKGVSNENWEIVLYSFYEEQLCYFSMKMPSQLIHIIRRVTSPIYSQHKVLSFCFNARNAQPLQSIIRAALLQWLSCGSDSEQDQVKKWDVIWLLIPGFHLPKPCEVGSCHIGGKPHLKAVSAI